MKRRNLRSLQRKKEQKRLRLILIPLLLMLLAGAGIFASIRFLIPMKEIVFIGNHHLKNDELRSLIKVKQGDELFELPGRTLYESLRKSPWIKNAVIRRELSGRMLVKVAERVPVAILSAADGLCLIDSEGYLLERIREGTVLLLPVIKDIDPAGNKETYREAVRFVNVLHAKRVLSSDGSIEVTGGRPEDITLKINGIVIKVGMGDFEKKLERLEFVKDEVQKRNMTVEYIDLRFANKIVVKPVSREPEEQQEKPMVAQHHGKKKKK